LEVGHEGGLRSVLEAFVAPVRRYGMRSALLAVTIVATLAGLFSASTIVLPLWQYLLIAAGSWVGVLLAFMFSTPRYKFWLFSLIYRRPVKRKAVDRPYYLNLQGTKADAPVLQVAAGRKVDRVYEMGLRALLDAKNPVAITAAPARDVSHKDRLPAGMWGAGGTRTESVVDPTRYGIPVDAYSFERQYTGAADDMEHSIAIKDVIYLPHLAVALRAAAFDQSRPADPFMWPEHCVDIEFLAAHDLVVVSGGDTNFWHGALFEPIYRAFAQPASTIPLACDLRDPTGELSFYGSASINLNLYNRHLIPGLEKARRFELDERRFPTAAMILAVDNPFARALRRDHWCVFVAGTRSLGTSGAVLALAAIIEEMRSNPSVNYTTLVATAEPDVTAAVSALIVRTVRCEFASDDYTGVHRHRGVKDIPLDKPDPDYRDSYVPVGVEYLDNHGDVPEWKPLVTLDPIPEEREERAPVLAHA
jgi:hypothetical protein